MAGRRAGGYRPLQPSLTHLLAPCYTRRRLQRPSRKPCDGSRGGTLVVRTRAAHVTRRVGARTPAQGGGPSVLMDASQLQLIILPAGIIAILFAIYLARDVLARDTGTQAMQDVAGTIYEGAVAFIRRQYTTIAILAVVGAVGVGILIAVFETKNVADTDVFGVDLGFRTG